MNLELLRKKLLAAARGNPPTDRVPYAFEKRILAKLQGHPRLNVSDLWAHALWRAVAPCVAVALVIGAWSFVALNDATLSSNGAVTENEDLSQHFEQVMLADVGEPNEEIR